VRHTGLDVEQSAGLELNCGVIQMNRQRAFEGLQQDGLLGTMLA
jgi:hypothetical protein